MNWVGPLLLTLQLMVVSVTIASILGIAGAWAGSLLQSGGRAARALSIALAGCMLFAVALPLVLHAAAWESTAGKFGWLFLTQSGARAEGTSRYGLFAGLVACGWIHALFGAAIVTLATWHGVVTTPSRIVQQSRLDLGPQAAWWRVRLPLAAPWLLLGLLLTGLLAATEMTVVDLYGFRTLADEFYLFYAVDPSLSSVLMTCAVPLAIAGVVVASFLSARRRTINTQLDRGENAGDHAEHYSTLWRGVAAAVAVALIALIVGVPLFGMLVKLGHEVTVSGADVQATWSPGESWRRFLAAPREFWDEYQWTAMIAALGGISAALIATPLAMLGRSGSRWERWFDAILVVVFVIPGPIVGMVIVWIFQSGIPGAAMLYQQTLIPTLMALMFRAVPVAYWVLRSAYRGIPDSVIDASQLDTWLLRRWWSLHRPLLRRGWLVAALAAGVVASGDVPATLPVIPPGVTTVGTRLFGLLHSGARYQEAALALWYVLSVVAISSFFLRQSLASRGKVE